MFSILGGISIAYLTSLAATKVQPSLWIYMLLTLLESPSITKYCNISPITDQASYIQYADFLRYLQKYIDVRFEDAHISGEKGIRKKNKMIANPTARIKFYNMFIYDKDIDKMVDVPRSFGDDILNTMIVAYDTLLESGGVFEKVVYYGVLIPGQIVNISALLGTWYGMVYGVKGVPERWLVHGADG